MSDRTAIEWTDATWNPVSGCTRVSEGCRNCYAEIMAARFSGPGQWGEGLAKIVRYPSGRLIDHRWTGQVRFNDRALDQPLRWRKPRRIFVCSTSDLFHESVPDEWIDRVFAVMAMAPQHTFQLLTKQPERMREYISPRPSATGPCVQDRIQAIYYANRQYPSAWPLLNVWLGTSVEDQAAANARIPHLLATPAAVRFVSAEPLLGPIRFAGTSDDGKRTWDWLTGFSAVMYPDGPDTDLGPGIDWVIVGGESGPGARPMHPDWARDLRDQCQAAEVAFFFKQWGAYRSTYDRDSDDPDWRICSRVEQRDAPGQWLSIAGGTGFHGDRVVWMHRSHKVTTGRLLDGQEWNEMPEGAR